MRIEVRIVCTRCKDQGWKADHRTTPEQCEAIMGRPCDYPQEHHLKPRRRLRVRVSR